MGEARQTLEEWQEDYNWRRPHSALDNLTPIEFLQLNAMDKMAAKGQRLNPKDSAQSWKELGANRTRKPASFDRLRHGRDTDPHQLDQHRPEYPYLASRRPHRRWETSGFARRFSEPRTVKAGENPSTCLLYTSPSPRDLSTSRMPSSA